ncbi:hypothetical protein HMPREF9436_02032 [Faecalibacterium cf. prausnitzii KLE1255]|uniref:Uncharacterized protein n=1 Tax=Faecalibacterium cf. prausnitzii KLE1255 TaxID=748224 RepID=E2ZK30_9FIRM|nr:hypothetical protein HMPREF9436_02032 [Faecalibacterium cf. prausnitzii KLE1255]
MAAPFPQRKGRCCFMSNYCSLFSQIFPVLFGSLSSFCALCPFTPCKKSTGVVQWRYRAVALHRWFDLV